MPAHHMIAAVGNRGPAPPASGGRVQVRCISHAVFSPSPASHLSTSRGRKLRLPAPSPFSPSRSPVPTSPQSLLSSVVRIARHPSLPPQCPVTCPGPPPPGYESLFSPSHLSRPTIPQHPVLIFPPALVSPSWSLTHHGVTDHIRQWCVDVNK